MKLNSSESRESLRSFYVSLFFRFLSLEQLVALKTSFIKTKFYPIHLREVVSQFLMTQIFLRGKRMEKNK